MRARHGVRTDPKPPVCLKVNERNFLSLNPQVTDLDQAFQHPNDHNRVANLRPFVKSPHDARHPIGPHGTSVGAVPNAAYVGGVVGRLVRRGLTKLKTYIS